MKKFVITDGRGNFLSHETMCGNPAIVQDHNLMKKYDSFVSACDEFESEIDLGVIDMDNFYIEMIDVEENKETTSAKQITASEARSLTDGSINKYIVQNIEDFMSICFEKIKRAAISEFDSVIVVCEYRYGAVFLTMAKTRLESLGYKVTIKSGTLSIDWGEAT